VSKARLVFFHPFNHLPGEKIGTLNGLVPCLAYQKKALAFAPLKMECVKDILKLLNFGWLDLLINGPRVYHFAQ
jgi:hypothetical protein